MLTLSFVYKIALDDLDFMQRVGHAQWLLLFERARTDLMEGIGYPATELFRDGHGVVVSKLNVVFKRAAGLGDRVQIKVSCADSTLASITTRYEAFRDGEHAALAEAEIVLVFIGKDGRPTRIPHLIHSRIGGG